MTETNQERARKTLPYRTVPYSSQSPEASGGTAETLRTDGININTVHFKTVLRIGSLIPF